MSDIEYREESNEWNKKRNIKDAVLSRERFKS